MPRAAGLLLLAAFLFPQFLHAETYLIIPFFNLSPAKNIEWIGESIAETLQESFVNEGLLTVSRAQRDAAFDELGIRRGARLTQATIMELATNLDAGAVIYGSFAFAPADGGAGKLTLRASVLDLRRLRRSQALEQTGPLEELSLIQARLARRVLLQLQPGFAVSEEDFLKTNPPIRLDALESYVRGLMATALDQKLALFANAARLEPAFSQPCFHLGRLHFERKDYRAAAEWLQRVLPSDSHYREALFFMGLTRYHLADFAASRAAFAQLAGDTPLGPVLNNLGVAELRSGSPEAAASLRRAVEADDSDPDFHFNLAYALWRGGEFEAAAASLAAVLERSPEDETAALLLDRCRKAAGPRPGEPRFQNLERLKTVFDDSAWRHLSAILAPKPGP